MATLSEKKKVELLEEAVLKNDLIMLKEICSKYSSFEFTARALGFACRYSGPEMVEVLLANGATFNDVDEGTNRKKYGSVTHTSSTASGNHGFKADYALLLVMNDISDDRRVGLITQGLNKELDGDFLKKMPVISESIRVSVIDLLVNHGALTEYQMMSLLYHAIMNNCHEISEYLLNRSIRIKKYDPYVLKNIELWDYTNEILDAHRQYYEAIVDSDNVYERQEIQNYFEKLPEEKSLAILDALIRALKITGNRFKVSKNVFLVLPDKALDEKYWNELDFSEIPNKVFYGRVINDNNISLLNVLLNRGYLTNKKNKDAVIKEANKAGRTEVISVILDYFKD